jgi:hypothetical protein
LKIVRVNQRRSDVFSFFALKLALTERRNKPHRRHEISTRLCRAGWIAFYLADQALYDGQHVELVARFAGSVVSGFAPR